MTLLLYDSIFVWSIYIFIQFCNADCRLKMTASSNSNFKKQGSDVVHLKKVWEARGVKLLLFVVIVIVLLQVLEFQKFLALYVPIPVIFSKQDSTSPPPPPPPPPTTTTTTSNNTPEFPSYVYIGSVLDAKNDSNASAISNLTSVLSPVVEDKGMKKKKRRKKKKKKVLEIVSTSEMEDLLSKSHVSPSSMVPLWTTEVDEQMLRAKTEIENAPIVTKDQQLYAPVFRNLSTFKRSYELMEKILKVYIYKDGEKPIFHNPPLVGIYASEGWFMKHMEESTHFLVDDPNKAHLFYLPFSSSRLKATLYIPDSHNHLNLITYLQNYIHMLSSKYPFWNRTNGADHFLAGCHDWATHETENSMKSALRALCTSNAQGGFEIGKDVALPATKIYHTRFPQRHVGGKAAHERTILAFFAGAMHGYLRPILINYWENKDPDMAISGTIPSTFKLNVSDSDKTITNPYLYYMKSSKYCLCPRGFEVWSTRVMESIYYECVPVIISDNFVTPLFEVLNWSEFSVIVPEKDVPRLKEVLMDIPQQRYLELGRGVREVKKHFLWNTKPVKYDLFHMILHSIWFNRLYQLRVQ